MHWTKTLKAENAALREALEAALLALRTIPQSRWDKYKTAGDSEHAMAYRKAVAEVDRLGLSAISRIHDRLLGQGVYL